eukprot:scaffold68531_cov57-Phaeocystis_antarctica.AAC.1
MPRSCETRWERRGLIIAPWPRAAPRDVIAGLTKCNNLVYGARSGRPPERMYRPPPGACARPVEVLDQSFIRSNDSLGRPPLYSPSPLRAERALKRQFKERGIAFPRGCLEVTELEELLSHGGVDALPDDAFQQVIAAFSSTYSSTRGG